MLLSLLTIVNTSLATAEDADSVFDVSCFKEFETAVLDIRDVAVVKLDFELGAVM